MWPRSAADLVEEQRRLAAARAAPWRRDGERSAAATCAVRLPRGEGAPAAGDSGPAAERLAVAACAVRFPRGAAGPGAAGDRAWAAAVVLRDGRIVDERVVTGAAAAPYEPGLLALREGALLERAVRALAIVPDVLLVDVTGRDHPRRAGLALHLGAVLGLPTVGITHRPLLASGGAPDDARGATAPLLLDGEPVGAWVRTRRGARPVAVHAGWRTTVDDAVAVVLTTADRHRTPEPLRHARRIARTARAQA